MSWLAGWGSRERAPPVAGFFGKIPARGDFVGRALPRSFTAPLEAWWQAVLHAAGQHLGAGWTEAWMVAPVWRFLLPPGACGGTAAAGLWLPSTDGAGRLYPLTFALVTDWEDAQRAGAFLDEAERIGLRAVAEDVAPDEIAARVAAAGELRGEAIGHAAAEGSVWWSEGGPLVAPAVLKAPGLPDASLAMAMLSDAGRRRDCAAQ